MLGIFIEASNQRGMGHLYRSLVLQRALIANNIPNAIFTNADKDAVSILAAAQSVYHTIAPLKNDDAYLALKNKYRLNFWIDDRLDTTEAHALAVRELGIPRITFDDGGEGGSLADYNIASLHPSHIKTDSPNTIRSLDYLVVDPSFSSHRRLRKPKENTTTVLVTMGGSDTWSVTLKLLPMIPSSVHTCRIVVGPANTDKSLIESWISKYSGGIRFELSVCPKSLLAEMDWADVAITGGGITPFEAAANGLPTLIIANEKHEISTALMPEKLGFSRYVGYHEEIESTMGTIPIPSTDTIQYMSKQAMVNGPGDGTVKIVALINRLNRG